MYPEIDSGSRVAKTLVAREFTDLIALSSDYSMVETIVPEKWVGKSLAEMKVRERFGINVVGIILGKEVNVTFDPAAPLPAEGILILFGANAMLAKFDSKKK